MLILINNQNGNLQTILWRNLGSGNGAETVIPPILEFQENGLAEWREHKPGRDSIRGGYIAAAIREEHPIEVLMRRGKDQWHSLLDRQSKTLREAVQEYRRRHGRAPPVGFEGWWAFCQAHNVKIVDDYDRIWKDLEPFYALSPEKLHERLDDLRRRLPEYARLVVIRKDGQTIHTPPSWQIPDVLNLLRPVAQYLPEDLSLVFSDHDVCGSLSGDDMIQAAKEAVAESRTLTDSELEEFEKLNGQVEIGAEASICPKDSLAAKLKVSLVSRSQMLSSGPSFIYDQQASIDFCKNPSHLSQHGVYGGIHGEGFKHDSFLRPLFRLSKESHCSEILFTPMWSYANFSLADPPNHYLPWSEKKINKIFWRGSATGGIYNGNRDWRKSHRMRLALLVQATKGQVELLVERAGRWIRETWEKKDISKAYMDIGVIDRAIQCDRSGGTCDEINNEIHFRQERIEPTEAASVKYLLDIDGNGWSSRLHRLLTSGSVIIKATIFPEWHSDKLIPWYHYVPCQIDYSDLPSILSFFIGPPDSGSKDAGHDHLAEQIAAQGLRFAEEHWRWEDLQAYMLRLLLEYTRLLQDDRSSWNYVYDPADEVGKSETEEDDDV
ncbi:glycosyl transferase family 90-domain-containing protein [Naematelia encephala]|uniref:Glycosyl transferase family 90-domain-containing protein n=1 Tax=Naematelia encephala TaxID=71784 RepID=A0A1Y2AZ86_9TREE|nr:glycosyl transferase family 90-domain-containing protein [Naematelia encephala]